MSNREKHEPHPKRGPVQRARGLDPEITAQPRPVADEIALETSSEPELSIDPEDLGSRFLSEAIEQGDFDPERAWQGDASLIESPARDQPLSGPNFVAGNSIWEQTVDLETRTQGAAAQLRSPAPPSTGNQLDAEAPRATGSHEFSLLDREGETSEIDLDEQGSHTRDAPSPVNPRIPARVPPQRHGPPAIRTSVKRVARSLLTHSAWMLRSLARRLEPRLNSST